MTVFPAGVQRLLAIPAGLGKWSRLSQQHCPTEAAPCPATKTTPPLAERSAHSKGSTATASPTCCSLSALQLTSLWQRHLSYLSNSLQHTIKSSLLSAAAGGTELTPPRVSAKGPMARRPREAAERPQKKMKKPPIDPSPLPQHGHGFEDVTPLQHGAVPLANSQAQPPLSLHNHQRAPAGSVCSRRKFPRAASCGSAQAPLRKRFPAYVGVWGKPRALRTLAAPSGLRPQRFLLSLFRCDLTYSAEGWDEQRPQGQGVFPGTGLPGLARRLAGRLAGKLAGKGAKGGV